MNTGRNSKQTTCFCRDTGGKGTLPVLLSCCLTSTEARWLIRDGDRVGRGRQSERLDRGNRPKKTGETVDRRQNNGSDLCTAQLLFQLLCWTVTKTMSVAPLLMNILDNSKQKTSNLFSPAPPPYSWSLLGKSEGPAPPPSSKISWSFDLAWNPVKSLHMDAVYTD